MAPRSREVIKAQLRDGEAAALSRTHPAWGREPARLRPMHDWLAKYERAWNDRLDRVDDYLKELQHKGDQQ